jgi:hypothetical protein
MTVSHGWESWDDQVAFSNLIFIVSIVRSLSRVPCVHLCNLYHVYFMDTHGFSLDMSHVLVPGMRTSTVLPSRQSGVAVVWQL